MGGGASKAAKAAASPPTSPLVSQPPVYKPERPSHIPPGPKNGELAPLPKPVTYTKPTWLDAPPPLQPIEAKPRSLSSAPAPSPAITALSSSPPVQPKQQEEAVDAFKNKPHLERKLSSSGINSPNTWKNTNSSIINTNASEESLAYDQPMDEIDEDDYYQPPRPAEKERSNADRFYEQVFADKMKSSYPPPSVLAVQGITGSPYPPTPTALIPSTFDTAVQARVRELEEDADDQGLYTAFDDFKNVPFFNQDVRKTITVPTLKLKEMGEKRATTSKPPAAAAAMKPPPEIVPEPKHGNFDNNKFRAAKKKNITDSIFQQTTYDYSRSIAKDLSPTNSSASSFGSESNRSTPESPGSTYSYSSDNSYDSPNAIRPNTPTHKATFDEFEENLIDSILNDPKIESPA